ncbi:MAG: hypothetical protein AAF081_06870 [Actinomycetota bacterium]
MTSEWAPPELPETEGVEAELLQQIAALRRRTDELPNDDFATRFALEKQLDELRRQLHDATADQLDEAQDEWAERAGRKGEHAELSREELAARARIMPGESGH